MKRVRYNTGVWSNGKLTVDLDNLNTKEIVKELDSCAFGGDYTAADYYITANGSFVCNHQYRELVDWYADRGNIYENKRNYEIIGKKFKKIKDVGELDEKYQKFISSCKEQMRKEIDNGVEEVLNN